MNPFRPSGTIVFLSDFGLRDAYVAEVHGVLLSRFPAVRIVDATHEIPPQDIRSAAFVLRRIVPAFPPGTVFLAVVDPGVGTSRRPVVAQAGRHVFVGPDNGLMSWAAGPDATWHLLERRDLRREPVAPTFHGRDLFGPAAAALASGAVQPVECGPLVGEPVVLSFPGWSPGPRRAAGTVLYVDRFGNLVVSIPAAAAAFPPDGSPLGVTVGENRVAATWGPYGCASGMSVHRDSSGFLEVSVPNGRADALLGAGCGDTVEVGW